LYARWPLGSINYEVNMSEAAAIEPETAFRAKCLVRPAKPSDMAAIRGIYSNAVDSTSHTFETEAPDEPEITRRWQATLDRGLPYLVAELEGYVVGYSYASQYRPRQGYRFTVEDSIYVRPDCTGNGVGRTLLGELLKLCKEKGCHSMVACICGINTPSVALHAGLGFQVAGILPEAGFKFGQWLTLTIMHRMLMD
jgi:phosphinothricin acetyltransferase